MGNATIKEENSSVERPIAAGTETGHSFLVHGDLLQANLPRTSRIRQRLVPQ